MLSNGYPDAGNVKVSKLLVGYTIGLIGVFYPWPYVSVHWLANKLYLCSEIATCTNASE